MRARRLFSGLRIAASPVLAAACALSACNGNAVAPSVPPADQSPMRAAVASPARNERRVYQPDWAGPVLFAPDERPLQIPVHRFHVVEGEWVVPKARPTINCSNRHEPEDGSSLWIALDGWSGTFKAHAQRKNGTWYTYDSTDILQAGSESDVPCYQGGPLRGYKTTAYFWIEWAGTKNIAVMRHSRNLPLKAGDTIYVRIAAATTGAHAWQQATLWFVDETTGTYLPARTFRSGCVDCGTPYQRPATLFGNTVEWITEATFYSSISSKLPNTLDDFGTVEMTRVRAVDDAGTSYDLRHPQGSIENVDWMTWNGVPLHHHGTLLACASISGPQAARFARAPYAIATPGDQGELKPKPKSCR
ncbi:MAG: hypothetical protein JO104_03540 [Candidatus Eremiobacteraeota bacterium]|nr:hypothetical protein [Candidatus Eremiobacteraeota bacterium]